MTDNTIWEQKLDDRYDCSVSYYRDGQPMLEIRDGLDLIHSEFVFMAHEPTFGPDVEDVANWQSLCEAVIDGTRDD